MKSLVMRITAVLSAMVVLGKLQAQPVISTLSTLNGHPGTTVGVSGTGFNSTSANNIVFFGATKATVSAATTTSLTVTVPAGASYKSLSVLNNSTGLAGHSMKHFLPTYDNSAYLSNVVNFSPKIDSTVGTDPFAVAAGDLDGDGLPDFAAVNLTSNTVSIYRNTTSGTTVSFGARIDSAVNAGPQDIALGDLDGDGKLDIAIASQGVIAVFRNTSTSGTISFAARQSFTTDINAQSIVLVDLDNDGRLEAATANFLRTNFSVIRNTSSPGSISFATFANFAAGINPRSIAAGDMDGDGKKDILVVNASSAAVGVYRNLSTGTGSVAFAGAVSIAGLSNPYWVAVADMDGDGKEDVIATNANTAFVSIAKNTSTSGALSFDPKVDFGTGTSPRNVVVADFNGDGKPDLAVSNLSSNTVSVFLNQSSGGVLSMAAKVDFATGTSPLRMAAADINNDSKADLLIPNSGSTTVSLLLNNPLAPITGAGSFCQGSTLSLSNTTTGGTWTSGNTAVATINSSGVVTGVSAGTSLISYTVTGGRATATVTVLAAPTFITGNTLLSTAFTTSLSNTISGGVWASSNTGVATIGSTNGVVSGVSTGTATISYTTSGVCRTTTVVSVNTPMGGLNLDGVNDHVRIGNILSANQAYTKEAWIKANSTASGNIISASAHPFFMSFGYLRADQTVSIQDGTLFPVGQWVHVAVTYDPSTTALRLYKNGNLVASSNSASTYPVQPIYVGEYPPVSGYSFDGSVDEVRIWGVARTQAQIQAAMNCNVPQQSGLLAYYRFDDGIVGGTNSGMVTTADYSGNGNCGTLTNLSLTGGASNFVNGAVGNCNAIAAPAAITGTASVCAGNTTTLTDTVTGGVWSSAATSVATVGTSGIVSGVSAGTTTISYTLNCQSATRVFTVYSSPSSITGNTLLSTAITTSLSNTVSGGTWTSTSIGVATIGSANGVVSGVSAGSTTITYTLPGGCFTTTVVTVNSPLTGINLDGSNDYVNIGSLLSANQAYTKEAWVKANASLSCNIISGGSHPFFLAYGFLRADQTSFVQDPVAFPIGQWVHVAVTYDPTTTTMKLYKNGNLVSTSNTAGSYPAQPIYIGEYPVALGNAFNGSIDEVRLWGVARTQAQIQANMNCNVPQQSGLIAYYRFDEGTSGGTNTSIANAVDYSGNGNCGVLTNMARTGSTSNFATGAVGNCNTISATLPSAITGASAICVAATITLSNSATGGVWSSSAAGVATIGTSGIVTGVAAGTATISYTLSCNRSTVVVTVLPTPAAITGVAPVCVGSTITLSNSVSGGSWVSSASSIATINSGGVVSGVSAGTSTISYSMPSGCFSTTVVTISGSSSSATISGATNVCVAGTTTLSSNISGGTWSTSSTTVSVDTAGTVSGISVGMAVISYSISSSCGAATVTRSLSVLPVPTAGSISGSSLVFVGGTITLTGSPTGGTWSTSSSSATVSTGGAVRGIVGGVASISYTHTNSCGSASATYAVTVDSAGLPSFTGGTTVCVGNTLTMAAGASGGVWTSSAPSRAAIGSSTGVVYGNSTGLAVISYSLGGSVVTSTVTVLAAPSSIFGTPAVCIGSTISLSNAVSGGSWTSADVSIATAGGSFGTLSGVTPGSTTITYTLGNGCYSVRTATVSNLPDTIIGLTTLCLTESVTLSNAVTGGVWSSSNPAIASMGTTTGIATASGFYGGHPVVTYTMPGGCYVTGTLTVVRLTTPITGGTAICEGQTTSLTHTASGGIWTSSNTSVATIGSTSNIVFGVGGGTATISYSIHTGCAQSVVVNVTPSPAAITGAGSICAGQSLTMSNTVSGGSWTSSATAVASISASTGVVNGLSAGTAAITYAIGACRVFSSVTVTPTPSAIFGTVTLCAGTTSTLTNSVSGGSWTSSDAAIASTSALTFGTLVTALTGGTATITYALPSGCSVTRTFTVSDTPSVILGLGAICLAQSTTLSNAISGGTWSSYNPGIASVNTTTGVITSSGSTSGVTSITYTMPGGCRSIGTMSVVNLTTGISGSSFACEGQTITLTHSHTGGSWSSTNSSTAVIGSGDGIVNAIAAGTTTISYSTASGCSRTLTLTVGVAPGAITGTANMCVGTSTTLSNSVSGGIWQSSASTIANVGSASGIVAGGTSGTATISYTIASCRATVVVTVLPLPAPINGTSLVCIGTGATLSTTATGGTWSSNDPSVASIDTAGVIAGVSIGTTTITYSVATACPAFRTVTVSNGPSAISGVSVLCLGQTSTFSNAVSGGTWISSAPGVAAVGSASGVVVASGSTSGTATITYSLAGGCQVTSTIAVVNVSSGITGLAGVCEGATATLSHAAPGGVWTSSNTSVATIGSSSGDIAGLSVGTTTISYTINAGCASVATATVNAAPASISGPASICEGQSLTLTNSVSGGTWQSSSANATVGSTSGIVTGVSSGTARISYTIGSCRTVTTMTVNQTPASITGGIAVCEGATLTLSNTVSGGTWSSSNGAIATIGSSSGIVSGVSAGTTTISYAVNTGCARSVNITVNIAPASIAGTSALCQGDTATFTNSVSGGVWLSSSASVTIGSASGSVVAITPGTAAISYTIGSCSATTSLTVNLTPGSISGASSLCVGTTITVSTVTSGGSWVSSNTAVATIGASGIVSGASGGTSVLSYVMPSGCQSTKSITVIPIPGTGSILGLSNVCETATITLSNASSGGVWSSPSATISINGTTGVVTGITAGSATVSYVVSNICGAATDTKTISISPRPIAGSISGVNVICQGTSTTFSASIPGGVWSSTDTSAAVSTVGVVTGMSAGNAIISYAVTNSCGTDADTIHFTVNPLPGAVAISGASTVTTGSTITLSSLAAGGVWSSSSANATVTSGGVVTGVTFGTSIISYVVTNSCGTGTATKTITVFSPPPGAILGTTTLCAGVSSSLSNSVAGGLWSSGTPLMAIVGSTSGVLTGVGTGGTAIITYNTGSGVATTTVVVLPSPSSILGNPSVCVGVSTTISSATLGGTWSSVNSAVATIGTTGILRGVSSGTATISYTLASGCATTRTAVISNAPGAITGAFTICIGQGLTLSNAEAGGTWSSSNTTIASVGSTDGIVTANVSTPGATTITYSMPGGCNSTTSLSVVSLTTSISGVSATCVGATTTISHTTGGGTWSSSNTSVATLTPASGIKTVHGVIGGSATITYTINSGCQTTYNVTVNNLPSTISGLSSMCNSQVDSFTNLIPGGSWTSSNPLIAAVIMNTGVVTAAAVLQGNPVISYTMPGGCFVTKTVAVVTLATSISGTKTICNGTPTTLGITTPSGTWSSGNISVATIGSSGVVGSVSPGTAIISYSINSFCVRTTTVIVNAAPASITGPSTGCSGQTTTFSNAVSGGIWASNNNSVVTVGTTSGAGGATAAGQATVSYSIGACHATKGVTVFTTPAVINGPATVCSGSVITLTCTTPAGTWSSTDIAVATATGTSTGAIRGISGGTSTISYTTGTGCARTRTMTVLTAPSSGLISGLSSVCQSSTITLSHPSSGGTWTSSNTARATVGSGTGIVTGVTLGTTTISYAVSNACGSVTDTKTVNIISLPTVGTISGPSAVCEAATITLTNATSGGTWSSPDASITIGSSSGAVTGVTAGTATISYVLATGCGTASDTRTITVNPLPAAGTISGATTVCVGNTITLTNTGTGGAWSSSTANASVSTVGVVSGVSSGTSLLSYAVTNGCGTAAATHSVVINPTANAGTIAGAAVVCQGASITLTNAVTGGVWSSPSGTIAVGSSSGIVSGASVGTATVSYSVTNSCGTDVDTKTITINPLPNAGSIGGASVVCTGLTITLTNAATGGVWSSSNANATVSASGVVTGVTSGTGTITYMHTNSCGADTATHALTINPGPNAGSIAGASSVCQSATITLTNAVSGGAWSSPNATVTVGTASGEVTGVSAGTATVSYSVTNSCGTAVATRTLTVNPLPGTGSISGVSVVCTGATATLSSSVSGGVWSSSSAAATISAGGVVSGVSTGTTTISYVVTNGCGSATQTATIAINPSPAAGTIAGATSLCEAATITLTNATSGGAWSRTGAAINIGAGTGIVSGVSAGTATVTYSVTNSCGTATDTHTITVNPLPVAGTISGLAVVNGGFTITLSSSVPSGTWSSSNTSRATVTASTGIVTGILTGTTTISYSVTNSCGTAVATKTVAVSATPPGPILGSAIACVGNTSTLSNAEAGGVWTSSNTGRATVGTGSGIVTGLTGGTCTISYTLNGVSATIVFTVSPTPNAINGSATVCTGVSATLSSTSSGGTWLSSNTSVATIDASTGIVAAVATGTTTITYTLGTGCQVTRTLTAGVTPAAITGGGIICTSSSTTLSNATSGGVWTSGYAMLASVGSASGIVTSSTFTGNANISYTMPGGCRSTTTVTVVNIGAITGSSSVCVGSATTLGNSSTGGTWSSSSPSVASISPAGIVTGIGSGTSTISYAISSGCSVGRTVTVFAAPGPILGTLGVCLSQSTTLSNSVAGGTWLSSHPTTANVGVSTGIVTGLSASSTRPTITYTLPGGCRAFATVTVVYLSGITGAGVVCEGQTHTLGNASAGGTWTSANTAIATLIPTSGVVFGVSSGTTTITYDLGSSCVATKQVTVNELSPIVGPTEVCVGQTVTLTNAISGGTWTSTYATIASVNATTGVVIGVAGSGALNMITYTIPGGCRDTSVMRVNYRSPIGGPTVVCEGSIISLSNLRTGGTWTSADPSVATIHATTAQVTGVAGGSATISYVLPTGCLSTYSVSVNPAPGPITGAAAVCVGSSITLSSTTAGGVWTRYYGTASIGSASGIVTGLSGSSTPNLITYTLPTGCRDTALVLINGCGKPEEGIATTGTTGISVVPNPNSGEFVVKGGFGHGIDEEVMISITNMLGQTVHQAILLAKDGSFETNVALPVNAANGMYLISVRAGVDSKVLFVSVSK